MSNRVRIGQIRKQLHDCIGNEEKKPKSEPKKPQKGQLNLKVKPKSNTSSEEEKSEEDSNDSFHDKNGYVKPFGIKNIGNSCYMNSGLQCLISVSLFMKNLNDLISKSSGPDILKEIRNFLQSHEVKNIKKLISKKRSEFGGFAQQDSYDFTTTLIDFIHDENKKGIGKLFYGKRETISKCTKCHQESKTTENFTSINLSFQGTRRISYVPYSLDKNITLMPDIPVASKKIKIKDSYSKVTIGKFLLVGRLLGQYKIINEISPEYSELYAFEIPSTSLEKDNAYAVIQLKEVNKEKQKIPITRPFICSIPYKSISKEKIKKIVLERLEDVINSDIDTDDIKSNMVVTKPKLRFDFELDENSAKVPFCSKHITIRFEKKKGSDVDIEDFFNFEDRGIQNEDKEIDLLQLFNCEIQQKQLEPGNDNKCDFCKKKTRRYLRCRYTKLPKILLFQVKRSSEDMYKTGLAPDDTEITFPPLISIKDNGTISNYNEITTDCKSKNIVKYELRSISHHSGSFVSGHYWANGKRGTKWYNFNDNSCREIDEPENTSDSGYFAFYQQTSDSKVEDADDESDSGNEEDKEEASDGDDVNPEEDEDDDPGFIRPFGIQNIGNTCFMNSSLQCFMSLSLFIEDMDDIIKNCNSQGLLKAFWMFMLKHKPNEIKKFVAKKNKAFSGYAQQDSYEFISTFIDSIHDENKKDIGNLFYGKVEQIVRCAKCHEEDETSIDFHSIILSVQEARRILYVPYSVKKHVICMPDIPVASSKIKIKNPRYKVTIGKFLLVGRLLGQYKVIDEISPKYSELYAFEIPSTSLKKDNAYIIVQLKEVNKEKQKNPITRPFICSIPYKSISKEKIKKIVLERLEDVINSDFDIDDIKSNMEVTKPESPLKFDLDKNSTEVSFCSNYITIRFEKKKKKGVDVDDLFNFGDRDLQNEDKEIDLIQLFNSDIQQKQLESPCKSQCDECKEESRKYLRHRYTKLPKILVFQIKRSSEDFYMTRATPDNIGVTFPPIISIKENGKISKYNEIITDCKDKSIAKYELRAISHHSGSFNSGHYWADGKRGEKWYNFDDSDHEEIEEPTDASSTAHVVFYQKIVENKKKHYFGESDDATDSDDKKDSDSDSD